MAPLWLRYLLITIATTKQTNQHEHLLPKDCLVHPCHYTSRMGLREMSIAFDHAQRFVTKDFGDFEERCPTHSHIGCCTVPQVMKMEGRMPAAYPTKAPILCNAASVLLCHNLPPREPNLVKRIEP
jgi:hypothetical protein